MVRFPSVCKTPSLVWPLIPGCLQPALRNFIVSQSTEVFERSYQPTKLRVDLERVFSGKKAEDKALFWDAIFNIFHSRDPNAPTRLSEGELDQFESRSDITELRKELRNLTAEEGSSSEKAKKVAARIRYTIQCLEKLAVQEKRRKYFKEADQLRAMNRSTAHLRGEVENLKGKRFRNSSAYAAKLAHLLLESDRLFGLADRLVAYLNGTYLQNECGNDDDAVAKPKEPPRCLFGCGIFFNSSALTRHVRSQHMHVFKSKFVCPECKRMKSEEAVIEANPCAWSSHVRRVHGRVHAPNLESLPDALCLLCDRQCRQRGFSRHLNTHSVQFDEPFSCPACLREGNKVEINGAGGWIIHVADVHGGTKVLGAVLVCESTCSDSKVVPVAIHSTEAQHRRELERRREADMKRKVAVASSSPLHPSKRVKSVFVQTYACSSEESDWQIPAVDPHADEEFWVDGRE